MPTLPEGTIAASHVWKRFRADRRGSLLSAELRRLSARLRGRPFQAWRWALRDVDFHAEPGDSIGLIGANGSGKSTLLKILTRVMYPYAGSVHVSGRVGALIEVSAGIHPQLTGRENVYLYGMLLGLSRKEVSRKFDEIVAFAEVEQATDRLVKFYSSGMKMRIGFAVAAFLEPHILLVDEVLAVGDASFQQKCLDRMRVVLSQNTTLVFVSHDLAAVQATCTRGIWLAEGDVMTTGPINDVLASYRHAIEMAAEASTAGALGALLKVTAAGRAGVTARTEEPLDITLVFTSDFPRDADLYLGLSEGTATPIFTLNRPVHLSNGQTEVRCTIPHLPLPRGRYYVWVGLWGGGQIVPWQPAGHVDVVGPDLDPAPRAVVRLAPVYVEATWDVAAL
ncbi:MAG: lipopolysaccharide transport system ATP-binding protein [Actinomycetota bacterium]